MCTACFTRLTPFEQDCGCKGGKGRGGRCGTSTRRAQQKEDRGFFFSISCHLLFLPVPCFSPLSSREAPNNRSLSLLRLLRNHSRLSTTITTITMFNLPSLSLAFLTLLTVTHAHFILNYPPTLGFDDDLEAEAPCGSFTLISGNDSSAALAVDGFPLALVSTHPQASWLVRTTTDTTAPVRWSAVMPVVNQDGLGAFCLPAVKLPASLAGQTGAIQVIQSAVDGLLYQVSERLAPGHPVLRPLGGPAR